MTPIRLALASAIALASLAGPVQAAEPPHLLGVGYKVGNGLGPLGLDVVFQPLPRLALDVQVARSLIGLDLAPSVQYHLDPGGNTYVALGYQQAAQEVFGIGIPRYGVFANLGWQWKPMPTVGVLLGVGYQYAFGSRQQVFGQTVDTPGLGGINLELGVRYYFL